MSYSSLLSLLLLLLANCSPSLLTSSSHPPAYYTNLYRENNLSGGHVIKLGPGNDEAAREALAAWPGESNRRALPTCFPPSPLTSIVALQTLFTSAVELPTRTPLNGSTPEPRRCFAFPPLPPSFA